MVVPLPDRTDRPRCSPHMWPPLSLSARHQSASDPSWQISLRQHHVCDTLVRWAPNSCGTQVMHDYGVLIATVLSPGSYIRTSLGTAPSSLSSLSLLIEGSVIPVTCIACCDEDTYIKTCWSEDWQLPLYTHNPGVSKHLYTMGL